MYSSSSLAVKPTVSESTASLTSFSCFIRSSGRDAGGICQPSAKPAPTTTFPSAAIRSTGEGRLAIGVRLLSSSEPVSLRYFGHPPGRQEWKSPKETFVLPARSPPPPLVIGLWRKMDLSEAELPLESHARKRERLALVSSVRVGLVS